MSRADELLGARARAIAHGLPVDVDDARVRVGDDEAVGMQLVDVDVPPEGARPPAVSWSTDHGADSSHDCADAALRGLGGRVEADGRGHREVERLGAAVDGHPHDLVAGVAHLRARPQASLPMTQACGAAPRSTSSAAGRVARRRRRPAAARPAARSAASGLARSGTPGHDRQVEQRAGGGAHDLGVVDVDAGVADQRRRRRRPRRRRGSRCRRCRGRARWSARTEQASGGRPATAVERDVQQPADGERAPAGLGVAHRGQHLGAHLVDAQRRAVAGGADDVGVPLGGLRG